MPALYAHHLFGEMVQEEMESKLREIASEYQYAFDLGLQGPDIFFFYRPWGHNPVQKYGTHLHEVSALPFFEHGAKAVRTYGRDSGQYAYLLGFLCHFVLDSECHPYVARQMERTGVAHLEIEEEFEKLLLRMEGQDPLTYPLGELVAWEDDTAGQICPFYPPIPEKTVLASVRGMCFVKHLFTAKTPVRRALINGVMKCMGVYHEMNGLMNQKKDNPLCEESSRGLLERLEAAVPLAAELQKELDTCIQTGKPLGARFCRTFE